MRYPYRCKKCQAKFDVVKAVSEIDNPETCEQCGSEDTERYIAETHFYGAAVEDAEYNPAFGEVVKSKRHRSELAKRKGMVEIGNESLETIHKSFDRDRERTAQRRYDDLVDTSITVR